MTQYRKFPAIFFASVLNKFGLHCIFRMVLNYVIDLSNNSFQPDAVSSFCVLNTFE
jgi:hypothetical protein